MLTSSPTDVLSHVAIRARSQGVLLATCFDEAELGGLEVGLDLYSLARGFTACVVTQRWAPAHDGEQTGLPERSVRVAPDAGHRCIAGRQSACTMNSDR